MSDFHLAKDAYCHRFGGLRQVSVMTYINAMRHQKEPSQAPAQQLPRGCELDWPIE
jgi:hypothetical protein